jgi:hypothetical protein
MKEVYGNNEWVSFTKSVKDTDHEEKRKMKNKVYFPCGYAIPYKCNEMKT